MAIDVQRGCIRRATPGGNKLSPFDITTPTRCSTSRAVHYTKCQTRATQPKRRALPTSLTTRVKGSKTLHSLAPVKSQGFLLLLWVRQDIRYTRPRSKNRRQRDEQLAREFIYDVVSSLCIAQNNNRMGLRFCLKYLGGGFQTEYSI